MTFCPGKKQPVSMTGGWDRDLHIDLEAISAWRGAVLVTLMEEHEFLELEITHLDQTIKNSGIDWLHLPIVDGNIPNPAWEAQWTVVGSKLREILQNGKNIVIHCKGSLARTGVIAAKLLVELGMKPIDAIKAVRKARPGAIENELQENYVLSLKPSI